jgi:hypothetical protein
MWQIIFPLCYLVLGLLVVVGDNGKSLFVRLICLPEALKAITEPVFPLLA